MKILHETVGKLSKDKIMILDPFYTIPYIYKRNKPQKDSERKIEKSKKKIEMILKCNFVYMPMILENSESHRMGNTDYMLTNIKHWVLIILDIGKKKIEYYDSLNNYLNAVYWGDLLKKWLGEYGKDFTLVHFNSKIVHQNGSLNCGYWVGLYTLFHTLGYNLEKIEKLEFLNENYIEFVYKLNVKRYFSIK